MERTFLVRFDDVCPTMNWDVWAEIERVLRAADVMPLVAVVPDNRHESLAFAPSRPDFWEAVAGWASAGWGIGMHGYQHSVMTRDGGLLGLNDWSEFAGLDADAQNQRIAAGLEIFSAHGLRPDAFVAPGHSFDEHTLAALREHNIRIVSDGFTLFPVEDRRGLLWIPQQLWRFRNVPMGVWTVAFHVNRWTKPDLDAFARDIRRFRPWISDLQTIHERYAGRSLRVTDRIFSFLYRRGVLGRRRLLDRGAKHRLGSDRESVSN